MKKFCKVFVGLGILFFGAHVLAAKSPAPDPNPLDAQAFSDCLKAVVVYQNAPEFSIKVASNPSTGFAWYLSGYDRAFIKPMNHRYYPASDAKVGAPGYEVWVFKAMPEAFVVPSMLQVKMVYARPFQLNTSHPKAFSVVTAPQRLRSR